MRFLYWVLRGRHDEILELGIKPGVTVQSFRSGFFESFEIPLPPLVVQKEIVTEVESNRNEIERLQVRIHGKEKSIQATIARIWGEDENSEMEA